MRNISEKPTEYQSIFIQQHFSQNLAVCEIMCKNMLAPDRPQVTNNTMQDDCDLHAGQYRHTHNVYHLLLLHVEYGQAKEP